MGHTGKAQLRTCSSQEDIADALFYAVDDHLGTSTLRLTGAAALIDRQEIAFDSRSPLKINKKPEQYYPFGDSSVRTWSKKRYRYVGKEKDAESGLYYYGARYYSAWTCRFISVDPIAVKFADLSSYNYAGNKPINKVDIDGLQEEGKQESPNNSSSNEGELSQEDSNKDNIAHSEDNNIIYNLDKENRDFDYGVWNSSTNKYELHCLSDSTMLDIHRNDDQKPLFKFSYSIHEDANLTDQDRMDGDVANTINAIWRADDIFNDAISIKENNWRDGEIWVDSPTPTEPMRSFFIERYAFKLVSEHWLKLQEFSANSEVASVFGIQQKSYSGLAEPDEFTNSILTLGISSLSSIAAKGVNGFGIRGGYGVFGKNGLKIGNYKIEALYANPAAGSRAGTIFSAKQMKPGGALWRWDYGKLHSTGKMGLHSSVRFHWNGVKYGSAAQRTWYPSSFSAPFFKPIR